jgi:hypothetical protein
MFPRIYTQDVITRSDELDARPDLPVPVRRLLIESSDDTKRAMRARALDESI